MAISEHANAAKQIRAILKANGIKAKVTCKSYSMGSSVTVELTDLPQWTMKAIRKELDRFEYGTFDAMTDCQGFKNREYDNPQVKHLLINNNFSDKVRSEARQHIESRIDMTRFSESDITRMTYDYLTDESGGYFKKPKVKFNHA